MPLSNRLAVMFGLNLNNKVHLSDIAEGSETSAAIAMTTARSLLKVKGDVPVDVFEGDAGFVIVGKTYAVFVPEAGDPQIRRIAAEDAARFAKGKREAEALVSKFRPRNLFKKIRHILRRHAAKVLNKRNDVGAGSLDKAAEFAERALGEHLDEQSCAVCDFIRTLLAEALMSPEEQAASAKKGRKVLKYMQKPRGERQNRRNEDQEPELTAGQKAKALLSDPQYGASAHQPGLFNRIMQAIHHEVHEEISPLLNEYIEDFITEHSVPNDGRIGILLHLIETAGKTGDFFIALTAAGKFFEVCERHYESETFDGWALRMMEHVAEETFEQTYYKQLLESAVEFQAEELNALGLPGPAEVIKLINGANFTDPDVNGMLTRLNVPDGKIGELMKDAEKIGESQIQEFHRMTRVKHTRMLRARRKHSPHKMREQTSPHRIPQEQIRDSPTQAAISEES